MRLLGWVLIIIGILALIVGIIYLVEPARSLPSFIPGHLASKAHHSKRGIAGIVFGGVVFIIGAVLAGRRPRRRGLSYR